MTPSQARAALRPARWIMADEDPAAVARLERELHLHSPAARVLANRGWKDPAAARAFLSPDLSLLHDPLLMRDAERAVTRIERALFAGERILVYGDYDVDGTTSVVILKKALELFGAAPLFHVPDRMAEGYGMNAAAMRRAAADGVQLIISVDTGIRDAESVKLAQSLGIDVIVTDHHIPEAELPPAFAVLNPNRRDCGYPEKNICGAGVTFKLIQALLDRAANWPAGKAIPPAKRQALLDSFLKLVAVATVADLVPLTGENRVIVRRGLSGFDVIRNAGLRALLDVSGFASGDRPSAGQVAFRLAPRINAAGRMASARDVIELFTTHDEARAKTLASQLDALNRDRQQEESDTVDEILKQLDGKALEPDAAALVFAGPGWHLGVLGIVASRLVERLSRPVFVLSSGRTEGQWSGSGRSIPAFHLLEALESMPELFVRFGGHRQAAGITVEDANLQAFRKQLRDYAAARLGPADLCPQIKVDAKVDFSELTEAAVNEVFSLAPFGMGNPAPNFYAANVEVAAPPRALGEERKHFKVPLRQHGRLLTANAWRWGERCAELQPGRKLEVLFQVDEDNFARERGYGAWSATLKDVRPQSP